MGRVIDSVSPEFVCHPEVARDTFSEYSGDFKARERPIYGQQQLPAGQWVKDGARRAHRPAVFPWVLFLPP